MEIKSWRERRPDFAAGEIKGYLVIQKTYRSRTEYVMERVKWFFIRKWDDLEMWFLGRFSGLVDDSETDGPNRPRPRRRTTNHLRAVDPIDCGDKK